MDLPGAYLSVAERSLKAADALLANNIQESASFYSYHAFESMGGALCERNGVRYPMKHPQKINVFTTTANRRGIGTGVATVAMIVASIRNGCLYPDQTGNGDFDTPESRITLSGAKDVLKRVKGMLNVVKKYV